jgi:hypothetical protein
MVLRIIFMLIMFHGCKAMNAQGIMGTVGAVSWSAGGTSVCESNAWSVFNNPAALAFTQKYSLGINSDQRFGQSELRTSSIAGSYQNKWFTAGAGINHFGYSLFNQQRLNLSIAKKLNENFALGVSLDYVATNILEYGNAGNVVPAVGILYKPLKTLSLGLMVFNPTFRKYPELLVNPIPTFARIGLKYEVSPKVHSILEMEQQIERPASWRAGLRYKLREEVHLSIGMATQPVYYTAGAGFKLKKMQFNFAGAFHEVMGFTPNIGCMYPID